jgi:hypothetical protein
MEAAPMDALLHSQGRTMKDGHTLTDVEHK